MRRYVPVESELWNQFVKPHWDVPQVAKFHTPPPPPPRKTVKVRKKTRIERCLDEVKKFLEPPPKH